MFGVVPGWMTQVLLEKKNEGKARILHRVAKFRNMNHDIFVYGSMEDELRFVGRPKEMQLKWWHLFPQERVAQSPVMMGTVWKNARGTQDALAIVNLSTNAVTETVKLPCAKAFAVTCRDGEAAVKQSGATAAITLGPQAMIMLKD